MQIGNYGQGTYSYTDTKDNTTSNGYLNDIGNASDNIYYRITVQGTTSLNIYLFSATFDTCLHLISSTGTGIAINDGNGPLCSGLKSSIVAAPALSQLFYYCIELNATTFVESKIIACYCSLQRE